MTSARIRASSSAVRNPPAGRTEVAEGRAMPRSPDARPGVGGVAQARGPRRRDTRLRDGRSSRTRRPSRLSRNSRQLNTAPARRHTASHPDLHAARIRMQPGSRPGIGRTVATGFQPSVESRAEHQPQDDGVVRDPFLDAIRLQIRVVDAARAAVRTRVTTARSGPRSRGGPAGAPRASGGSAARRPAAAR